MQTTLLNVRERLDNARGQLPERAERPTLLTSDPGERPIAVLALAGEQDMRGLPRAPPKRCMPAGWSRSPAWQAWPSSVRRKTRSASEVDPAKLRALDLTTDDLATAVRQRTRTAQADDPAWAFRFAVRALTEFQRPDEIANKPIGPARSGITLHDVEPLRHQRGSQDDRALRRQAGGWTRHLQRRRGQHGRRHARHRSHDRRAHGAVPSITLTTSRLKPTLSSTPCRTGARRF